MTLAQFFKTLREANAARQKLWDGADEKLDLTYRSNEMMGEAGEAANVAKKIERERRGLRGSRATKQQLADELADVIICVDLIAAAEGIDIDAAVRDKFNETSRKYDLPVFIGESPAPPTPAHNTDAKFIRVPMITRQMVREHPDALFVFGDNAQREGLGGQAREMRGEPNTVGVRTKWNPYTHPKSYFTDANPDCRRMVEDDLRMIGDELDKGRTVYYPADGVGTGRANLDHHAPKLAAFIRQYIAALERQYGDRRKHT